MFLGRKAVDPALRGTILNKNILMKSLSKRLNVDLFILLAFLVLVNIPFLADRFVPVHDTQLLFIILPLCCQ